MHDVITIGTATRDIFVESGEFKRVKDPEHLEKLGFVSGEAQCFPLGAKIQVGRPVMAVGGGAANAAVTCVRQGLKTAGFFKIGADPAGADIVAHLKKERITPVVVVDKKIGTSFSVILVSADGERTILNYRGASEDMTAKDVPMPRLLARWAYIAPGNIPFPIISRIAKSLHAKGTRIAINPSKSYIEMGMKGLAPLLNFMDVVVVNREEGARLTGLPYEDEMRIFKAFDGIVRGIAVLTDGEEGVHVADAKNIYTAGIFAQKKVADRTGAGDAFGSAFVASLVAGKKKTFSPEDIEAAIRAGSANATSVIEYVGAQEGILSKKELSGARWKKLPIVRRSL